MIKNYFQTAWKSLKKNKFFSSLNILGLAIGMAVFMLIAQYVHFERSYENFISGKEDIYRVSLSTYRSNELISASAENYPGVGTALKKELPDVINYARLYNAGYKNNVVITNENAKPNPIAFRQKKFLYADAAILSMMHYPMLKGNAATALAEPHTAVISEKCARLYFGNEDPIGKTLRLQDDDHNNELAIVTGVFKDIPANTHLTFDVLFSISNLYARGDWAADYYKQTWDQGDQMYTFVQLRHGANASVINAKLPAIVNKYKPQLKGSQEKHILGLQPLKNIHLYSELADEPKANGNATIVFFINLIGIFVLVIAWINYINLSTARALTRAKEVGVRKVAGAVRYQLILQFLIEAALTNFFSVAIAVGLIRFSLPYFNSVSGLSLGASYLTQPWFIFLVLILWAGSTLLSGLYPAFVLSSFKPVAVLKGKFAGNMGGVLLRKGLVVAQFTVAVAFIAATFIVYSQLTYMMNSNPGVNIHQTLVVERPGIANTDRNAYYANIDLFRNELKQYSSIEAVTASLTIPGKQREFKLTVRNFGKNSGDSIMTRVNMVDYNFFDAFKMKLLAGKNFSADDGSIILSEMAAHLLGFRNAGDAVGKTVVLKEFDDSKHNVIGVVNDYHQVSFKKPLEPVLFLCKPYEGEYYSMRVNTNHLQQTIQYVRQSWTKAFPGNPFDYFFLDDYFNQQYSNEQKFQKLFIIFATLAIIISCLGLFGLSSYTAMQRTKEIGIRKVLGASAVNITSILSKDFLKLVVIAVIIASPVVWIVMNKWLQNFAYRINISWWIFLAGGVVAIVIALATISFQTIKAGIANPVKSLRTE